MEIKDVSSSQIKQIGYDDITKKLRVFFNTGGIYDYYEVPETIWESFKNADSKGIFFSTNIKGIYEFNKIG